MARRQALGLLMLLGPALLPLVGAQDFPVSPGPGTRLRVTAPPMATQPIVGSLVRMTDREIVLAVSRSDRTVIPRSSVSRIERSEGHHGHAVAGLLVGAAVGTAAMMVAGCSGETCTTDDYLLLALWGGGLGALPGAGVGAVIRTERWAEVPGGHLRATVEVTAQRGVGLRLAWAW